jgi:hypothetical protein
MVGMGKTPQVVRVKSKDQFSDLWAHVVTETHRAWDHWNLLRGIDVAGKDYNTAFYQSPQFWAMTTRAHSESVLLRLTRLFDPSPGALSLGNLLQTIFAAINGPAIEARCLNVPGLDAAAVKLELAEVSEKDALVARLIAVRNYYLAHRASRHVLSGSFAGLELEEQVFETLLNRASRIGDKYCQLYGRQLPGKRLPGGDDYKQLLRLLRLGMAANENT